MKIEHLPRELELSQRSWIVAGLVTLSVLVGTGAIFFRLQQLMMLSVMGLFVAGGVFLGLVSIQFLGAGSEWELGSDNQDVMDVQFTVNSTIPFPAENADVDEFVEILTHRVKKAA